MKNEQRKLLEDAISECQACINGMQHPPYDAPESLRQALKAAAAEQAGDQEFQAFKLAYGKESEDNTRQHKIATAEWRRGQDAIASAQASVDRELMQHPAGQALAAARTAVQSLEDRAKDLNALAHAMDEQLHRWNDRFEGSSLWVMAVASRGLRGEPSQWPALVATARHFDEAASFRALRGWWMRFTNPIGVQQIHKEMERRLEVHAGVLENQNHTKAAQLLVEQAELDFQFHRNTPAARTLLDGLDTQKQQWKRRSGELGETFETLNRASSELSRKWEAAMQAQWQKPAFAELARQWVEFKLSKMPRRNHPARNASRSRHQPRQETYASSRSDSGDWLMQVAIMANLVDSAGAPSPHASSDWSGGGGLSGGAGASGGWDSYSPPSPSYDSPSYDSPSPSCDNSSYDSGSSSSCGMD